MNNAVAVCDSATEGDDRPTRRAPGASLLELTGLPTLRPVVFAGDDRTVFLCCWLPSGRRSPSASGTASEISAVARWSTACPLPRFAPSATRSPSLVRRSHDPSSSATSRPSTRPAIQSGRSTSPASAGEHLPQHAQRLVYTRGLRAEPAPIVLSRNEAQPMTFALRPARCMSCLASSQRASNVPVKPLARIAVSPADLPFLDCVTFHRDREPLPLSSILLRRRG